MKGGYLSADVMRFLIQIIGSGGFLERLCICGVDMSETGRKLATQCLQMIMGCRDKNERARSTPPSREGMDFYLSGDLNRHAVAAVYSALSTSQTARSVYLYHPVLAENTGCDSRRHLWHWIAYALFSRHATHRIQNVFLPGNLSMQDIECVDELLQHPNPLALLCGNRDATTIPDTGELVTASRFLFVPPSVGPTNQREHEHYISRQQVRVIPRCTADQDEDYESVLLPGYGHAWVRQSDVEECHRSHTESPRLPDSLTFCGVTPEGMDAVPALLQLVGHNIAALNFECFVSRSGSEDTWLLDVLACCPSLKRLGLRNGCLESLDTFAKAFELGYCRVHELEARGLRVQHASNAPVFLRKLADPDHPMSKSLRCLNAEYTAASGSVRAVFDALSDALDSNRRLRSVNVRATYETQRDEHPSEFDIEEEDTTPIHVPSDLQAKLAFLSVVTRANDGHMALAADTVSLVFQFAAQYENRRVWVEIIGPPERDEGDGE